MEGKVTISITATASQAKDVLDLIMSHVDFVEFDLRVTSCGASSVAEASPVLVVPENATEHAALTYTPTAVPRSLRHFLHDTDRKIMKFVVDHHGQFYNADLAIELGVDTPLTCFPLGRITRKLRKVGVKVEGAQGENWYTKHRTTNGTLLNVRPDVLEKFREALHD